MIPLLLALAQDDRVELAWKLPPGEVAVYDVTVLSPQEAADSSNPFALYGYEVTARGESTWTSESHAFIGRRLALLLPDGELRVGDSRPAQTEFREAREIGTLAARGTIRLEGWETIAERRCAFLLGQFELREGRLEPTMAPAWRLVEPGTVTTRVHFDPERGIVVRAEVHVTLPIGSRADTSRQPAVERYERLSLLRTQDSTARDLPTHIVRAIDRGVEAVRRSQQADGSFGDYGGGWQDGLAGLALFTLLVSGVPADDPAIDRGFAFLADQPVTHVYSASTRILALEARRTPPRELRNPEAVERPEPRTLTEEERRWLQQTVDFLVAWQATGGGRWSYQDGHASEGHDHSNTQTAALALRAAVRAGARVPVETWRDLATHFLNCQARQGPQVTLRLDTENGGTGTGVRARARGWSYNDGGTESWGYTTGSMTAAGIGMLVIAREQLAAARALDASLGRRLDEGIRDGQAWIAVNFSAHQNRPIGGGWAYYYLYGLERAGVLLGIRQFGAHDWYREGAAFLVARQNEDGTWPAWLHDACFALLFLKKATLPVFTGGDR